MSHTATGNVRKHAGGYSARVRIGPKAARPSSLQRGATRPPRSRRPCLRTSPAPASRRPGGGDQDHPRRDRPGQDREGARGGRCRASAPSKSDD
jgi:hypothetical protein